DDLLLAVTAAALVAVHRQRALVEARARGLEALVLLVQVRAPRRQLRLLGAQRQRDGALALLLERDALGERARLPLEVREAASEQDPLEPDHLLAQRAVAARLARLPLQALELLLDL